MFRNKINLLLFIWLATSGFSCTLTFKQLSEKLGHSIYGTYQGIKCEVSIEQGVTPNKANVTLRYEELSGEFSEKTLRFGPSRPSIKLISGSKVKPDTLRINDVMDIDVRWIGSPEKPEIKNIRFLKSGTACRDLQYETSFKAHEDDEVIDSDDDKVFENRDS